jgi:hypothetical protein
MQTNSGPWVDILNCAPPGITLRQVQIDYLKWVEANYDNYDVFVGILPVAAGKSCAIMTVAEYISRNELGKTVAIAPNKMLQDQYSKDFEDLLIVKGASNYHCNEIDTTCEMYKKLHKKCCGGANKCPYIAVVNAAQHAQTALFNFHIYTGLKIVKNHLIIDECHNAVPYLYSLFAVNLWKCEEDYPDDLGTNPTAIANWLSTVWMANAKEELELLASKGLDSKEYDQQEKRISHMVDVISGLKEYPEDFIIEINSGKYWKSKIYRDRQVKGSEQEYIYIKPLKIDKIGRTTLWPKGVDKIFFLSATISEKDIEILGLSNRRVGYFECDSPIPPENRPFVRWPVANMSFNTRGEGIPRIAEAIKKLAEKHKDERGLIHCTYETAKVLRTLLHGRRFLFHSDRDKKDVYDLFRSTKKPLILIASGMAEGIDLPDDAARWQVITQIMYPYLGDAVNKWISRNDPQRYKMMTIQVIEQQSGRIVRHPLDKGVTYCLDAQFDRLFFETHTDRIERGKKSMWHKWFIDGMKGKL